MSNRNEKACSGVEGYLTGATPVLDKCETEVLIKAFVRTLLKLRGGSSDAHVAPIHDASLGANQIHQAPLSQCVSPSIGAKRGSDPMTAPQQNRNVKAVEVSSAEDLMFGKVQQELRRAASYGQRGTLGQHQRWHLNKGISNPTCVHCQMAKTASINNQPREQQGQ